MKFYANKNGQRNDDKPNSIIMFKALLSAALFTSINKTPTSKAQVKRQPRRNGCRCRHFDESKDVQRRLRLINEIEKNRHILMVFALL